MNGPLSGRIIVLGATGGIAVYKACDVVRRLTKLGADVRVILTESAQKFVPPLTFQTLSGNPVASGMFDQPQQWDMKHISWAKAADLFIIAPATANCIAKCACGIADDMLTSTILATQAPLLFAPAMNRNMWSHPATQQNLQTLLSRGAQTVGPGTGMLANGDMGVGRMAEPEEIVEHALRLLSSTQDMQGLRVLVTAGPTREAIDPVRYLSNHSSGKMGYAIANAAKSRGAQVTLVTGPVSIPVPGGVTAVNIVSTQDLHDAMMAQAAQHDVIIQAAAPADFTMDAADQKIKKEKDAPLSLALRQTVDVAAAVGRIKKPRQTLVAFAAETENLLGNARRKLSTKHADLVVANDVSKEGAGFSVDTNIVTLVTANEAKDLPLLSKDAVANEILNAVLSIRESIVR